MVWSLRRADHLPRWQSASDRSLSDRKPQNADKVQEPRRDRSHRPDLLTHAHADHLGDAPALARQYNVPIIAPAGLASSLAALEIVPPELAPHM
ncbi:MAG TPA: MBL fold metallo-hydrolase, partial [Burkholderiaceae bacterium]|nr:MBL fold metallo-hydrolase [Burkholderiaceae bacterium]